ncbi:MAG: FtsQ-type POTRA domain-containing protein [Gemmatimonadales bacterium]
MRRRLLLIAAGAAVIVLAVIGVSQLLRQVSFFRVRQVELVGLKYLAPEDVMASLRLGDDRNLFDPSGEVVERAEALPGVVDARVVRRLPGTLRIVFVERAPVGFAPGPAGLVAVDAAGRRLPYDPTATGFDLPVLASADTTLARVLGRIRSGDSVLFQQVDAVRRGAGETVIVELGRRAVLFGTDPAPERIRAVEAVRRHLHASGDDYAVLDARFADWIVVRKEQV